MGVKYELVAKAGEYESNGEKKTRWHRCGVVIERQDGSLSARIESLPIAFDGWLNLWEPKAKDAPPPAAKRATRAAPTLDEDSDLPF
jgi:hypothetical protein